MSEKMPDKIMSPMSPRTIMEKLYEEGSFEGEHRDIHPDRIEEALTELQRWMESQKDVNKITCEEEEFIKSAWNDCISYLKEEAGK